MDSHGLYWTLWMLSCFGQYLSEDLQFSGPANGAVGESVVFAPDNPPSTSVDVVQWNFGTTTVVTALPDSTIISSAYRDRVHFDNKTFALELQNLRLVDSGIYRLTVIPSTSHKLTGETSLQVFERISDVRLDGPEESLIEGKSSANITSKGTGNITSVQWMKDNSPLSPSNSIIFSSDKRSVFISPVQRSDSGEYQCTYTNPVSSETVKLSLIINYGPDDVSIKGEDVVDLGVRVSLSCSANSQPSASFSWKFNGSDTGVTTDSFIIDQTNFIDSGDYECTALNSVTEKNATQTHALLVKVGGGGGSEGGGGLPAGAIAGIVIGTVVAVAGICGLIVYLTITKIPELNLQQKRPASEAQKGQDSDYEEMNNFQRTNGEGSNSGNMSESSLYVNLYENVRHGVSNRPRAPTPPQVSNPPPVRR